VTLHRVSIPSPNYSSRNPAGVRLLVLHTAEGARTIESLGSYFANPASAVSSHAGADDKANTIGVYVQRADKAWTQSGANSVAVSIEMCAFTAWDSAEWHRHPNMLANCAAWLAEEAAAFGLPLVRLSPSAAQGSGRGVCMHRDLGSWGGGHVDVGDGFPFSEVLAMATGQTPAPQPPQPTPEPEEVEMLLISYPNGGTAILTGDYKYGVVSMSDSDKFKSAGIKQVELSQKQFEAFPWGPPK
jgi:N-acetylmuramoyl-L-alanine amidase